MVWQRPVKAAQVAQLVVVVLAAAAVFLFVRTVQDSELRRVCTSTCALGPHYAARNRRAPDFDLPALGGGTVKLSSFRGRPVILNFWTKTCRPCLEEMPSLAEMTAIAKTRSDVAVVTICTDETLDDARATLSSVLDKDPPFIVLLDPEREVVSDRFGTKLFPETWFVDREGIIRARIDGARTWTDPLVFDFIETLSQRVSCDVEFHQGNPAGPFAAVCGNLSGDG